MTTHIAEFGKNGKQTFFGMNEVDFPAAGLSTTAKNIKSQPMRAKCLDHDVFNSLSCSDTLSTLFLC